MNKLILGDNLEILKTIDSETIDLIYLDPPFFSNRNYEVIWGDEGEIRSFKDRWSGGMDHYIGWLKERVEQMHRILKASGSIFLHCDWHANSYIRVDILDKIFGPNNFIGEIVWQRANCHNDAKNKLAVLTDTIWYYSKSGIFIFHPIYSPHRKEYIESFYTENDNDGKGLYSLTDISSPNPRPNMMYDWKGYKHPAKGWRYEKTTMQKLDEAGQIYYPKDKNGNFDYTKRLRLKRYLDEQKGQLTGNLWVDIPNIQAHVDERIGYPTQKPQKLLQRIIECASNEGDTIMDPFCGGGTTMAVADKLGRSWIGIDQSVQAIKVTELRLNKQQDLFSKPFSVQLHKYDYDTLRYQNAFDFENWIISQFGGNPNIKQRGDLGIDGKMPDGTPIQVKRSDSIGRNVIDNFRSAIMRSDRKLYDSNKGDSKPVGYLIAFSFNKGAIEEVARLKNKESLLIELIKVSDIVPMASKPKLLVSVNDVGRDKKLQQIVEFKATAESEVGIEFYSWDFSYTESEGFKPDVIIDKEGFQSVKFKPGIHLIAVKVVDDDGIENVEIIKLKVNGIIEINK